MGNVFVLDIVYYSSELKLAVVQIRTPIAKVSIFTCNTELCINVCVVFREELGSSVMLYCSGYSPVSSQTLSYSPALTLMKELTHKYRGDCH